VAIFAGRTRVLAPRRGGVQPMVLEAPPPHSHPHQRQHPHAPYGGQGFPAEYGGAPAVRATLSEPPPEPSSELPWMRAEQHRMSLGGQSYAPPPHSQPHPHPHAHPHPHPHPRQPHSQTLPTANGREAQQYYVPAPQGPGAAAYGQHQQQWASPPYDQQHGQGQAYGAANGNGHAEPARLVLSDGAYHPLHTRDASQQQQQQQQMAAMPAYPHMPLNYSPPHELQNLGLASRDSHLDERWVSFMHSSGYF
jgi:hypothetical protein